MSKPRRFTNGQKAGIHGLILAGVGYAMACEIVATNHAVAARYVAVQYRHAGLGGRRYRHLDMEKVRAAYQDVTKPMTIHARRLGVKLTWLYWVAKKRGWKRKYDDIHSAEPSPVAVRPAAAPSPMPAAAARPAAQHLGRTRTLSHGGAVNVRHHRS